jgi:AcrR family transcriptional regulator
MPRPYQAGERRLAARAATRAKIIEAARALLADPRTGPFSIDAIAERADVARMTIYYQFESKAKLLEALFDDIAARSDMRRMRRVFEERDLQRSLGILVDVFCHLWETESSLLRRLTALARLDPDVDNALKARGKWRREALSTLFERSSKRKNVGDLVNVLYAITTFETYATLRETQSRNKVHESLKRAADAIVRSY